MTSHRDGVLVRRRQRAPRPGRAGEGGGGRSGLEAIVADRNRRQKHVWRARIVLLSADGWARCRSCARPACQGRRCGAGRSGSWPRASTGCCATRRGRRAWRRCAEAVIERVVEPDPRRRRPARRPTGPAGHGRGGRDQPALGAADLAGARSAPHRIRTFKLSNDPAFAAKLQDIVGLYVDPPAHAVVLSVDEKSHVWMAPGSQEKSWRVA